MCGIAGIFNLQGVSAIDMDLLRSMAAAILHRGPDEEGFYSDNRVGFAFRRLSILDLQRGGQPHFNEDSSIVSVCNGEIFNYRELRDELIKKGHSFRSQTDVEVLVHLYEEHGAGFINSLNGQFAFVIYDKKRQTLLAARDQMGICPLFYTQTEGIFIFASEIKSIIKHPYVRREVDLTGLDLILTFPGLVSPYTMFKDICSLKPGNYLRIEEGCITTHEYWDMEYPLAEDLVKTFKADYAAQLEDLLKSSVKRRLQADVPVGFYLSGGVDSSLIAALINGLHPDKRWESFSIGFQQFDIDERRFQQMMVDHCRSYHNEIVFSWQDIRRRLSDAVYHAEMPLRESYNTCSLALSELVRSRGIKVILTGEGSDELFGGYVGYRLDAIRRSMTKQMQGPEEMIEGEIRERLWGDSQFFYERDFYPLREIKDALYSEGLAGMLNDFECINSPLVNTERIKGRHYIHQRSYVDMKMRMSDHLLSDHGDRVSMANSIEARYPFLDAEVIEFARTLPVEMIVSEGIEKRIVRDVAHRYIPKEIAQREKFGFVAPGSPFLLRNDPEWTMDMLAYEKIKREGYFNPDTIERLTSLYAAPDFSVHQTFEVDLLMIALSFEIFLERFGMPHMQT